MKKKQLLLLLTVLSLNLVSCSIKIVPDYSSLLEEQIANGAKMNDKMYLDMLADDPQNATYLKYANRYSEIKAEINSIELRNNQRDNNKNMLAIVENLKNKFDEYEKDHKEKPDGLLPKGEIKSYQSGIKGFWLPLLKAEGGLKKAKSN